MADNLQTEAQQKDERKRQAQERQRVPQRVSQTGRVPQRVLCVPSNAHQDGSLTNMTKKNSHDAHDVFFQWFLPNILGLISSIQSLWI